MPGLLDTKGFQFYSLKFGIAVTAEMLGVLMFAFYSSSAPSEYAAWANGLSLAVAGRAGYLSIVIWQPSRMSFRITELVAPCSVYNRQHQRRSSQSSCYSGHCVHWAHIPSQSCSVHSCADCWCHLSSPHPGKLRPQIACLTTGSVNNAFMPAT